MSKEIHQNMLSNLELSEFFHQMGIVLKSGISSLEGLTLLAEDAQNENERSLLINMIEEMELSGSLYQAVSSAGVFPAYALHMLKLGEETGTLDDVMPALSNHYTREANFSSMLKSALLYPSIMLGMMFLVILVLLTKVMPVFQQVFIQLGQDMDGFSAALLQIGETLSRNSVLSAILIVVLAMLLILGRRNLPFYKNTQEKIAACRFLDGLSISLKSGLTSEESLALASGLVENEVYLSKIAECKTLLDDGATLSDALHKTGILSGTYARMVHLADRTGTIDEVLGEIASEYEHTANARITRFISILEPTLVIILSLIVGIILFSVMLPLLGIMSGM